MTRPAPARLGAVLVVCGVLAGAVLLLLPVRATFGGDPLLRLEAFGAGLSGPTAGVACGSPLTGLGRASGSPSLYAVAKDRACQHAASRRVATAAALTGVVGLGGALVIARRRDGLVAAPA